MTGDLAAEVPAPGVVPFEPLSPSWSDGAVEQRFVAPPRDASPVPVDADEDWPFPECTVLIEDFARIETRPLSRTAQGWKPHVYLWDADPREARRIIAGERVQVPTTRAGRRPAAISSRTPTRAADATSAST